MSGQHAKAPVQMSDHNQIRTAVEVMGDETDHRKPDTDVEVAAKDEDDQIRTIGQNRTTRENVLSIIERFVDTRPSDNERKLEILKELPYFPKQMIDDWRSSIENMNIQKNKRAKYPNGDNKDQMKLLR